MSDLYTISDCQPGEMCVDLNQKGTVSGSLSGVTTLTGPTGLQDGKECSRQATFKVTFDKLPSSSTGLCHTDIYTQRRMLKVQMYFSDKYRNLWMFNIGDSPSNDGWSGDYGDTEYEAEIQAVSQTVAVYANNVNRTDCRAQLLYQYNGATNTSTSKVNVWIANHYLKVANDNGLCERNCNKCLYGLNGQYTPGSINQDIHVAANRVVAGSYRNGYGLCFMKMSWVGGPEV
ncbi:uncharacterized protein LOC123526752 [Mercenaria mercenaria]|uniref:uncharacterized protein LOC123526752 n=1 Tax=Mercenaria mercenaria TaxID=6596 RepID=UPI00234E3D86|nr:uncharacterized protein LOC123526752 [Mercenaria mercenaria]